MKTLKFLMLAVLSITVLCCSSSDDSGDGDDVPRDADFSAAINGETFTNYQSALESYYATHAEGTLTIVVTDANTNIVRLFINETHGLQTGSQNIIGNVSPLGYVTTVTVRDQANQITYTSVSGHINILENVQSSGEEDTRYVTGNFELVLNAEMSSNPVTMTGVFENIRYVN